MKMAQLEKHWDELDRFDRERYQLKQLKYFLAAKVLPFSAHYRKLFQEVGAQPEDINSWEDWAGIPFTTKSDLLPGEDGSSPARDFVLVPDEQVLRRQPAVILSGVFRGREYTRKQLGKEYRPIMMTSTTGRSTEPVPFLYTRYDIENLCKAGGRIMSLGGSVPEYRHMNLFPYAPHLAFWQAHYSGMAYNTFMVGSGGGKVMGTLGNVRLASRIDPDVMIGMPTFIYHVLQVAVEQGQKLGNIKTIVLGGEKVPAGMRRKLRGLAGELGSPEVAIISTYGFTEAKMAFPECIVPPGAKSKSGFHLFSDMGLIEIIDPGTGEVLGENEPGEIVYTALDSRGSIVLRYRTGDQIEQGIRYDKCEYCGRTLPRLMGRISRVSDVREVRLDKIKGTLVNFNELEHILDEFDGVGSWQIELRKKNDDPFECDELHVHLTRSGDQSEKDLIRAVENRFVAVTEVKPNRVHFHEAKVMRERQGVGKELKEQRFIDNRTTN